jgi:tRNA pseudouridine13 synthase
VAVFQSSPETFLVEEIPAYPPSGSGEHCFIFLEKRDLTTPEACKRLARALAISDRDIGYAGLKDRHAITRQWLSIPAAAEAKLSGLDLEGMRVLQHSRHNNKLRTGHNKGNRFTVVLRDVSDEERPRIEAQFAALLTLGLPNRFGVQRFGQQKDNAEQGLAVLKGEKRERDGRKRRFLLSALQSAVFNEVLALRIARGILRMVIEGDVLQKTDTGGVFYTDDPVADQLRLDAGALTTTGPLPGSRVLNPPPGTEADRLESTVAAEHGLSREAIVAAVDHDLPGARRPLVVPVTPEPLQSVEGPVEPQTLRLCFRLPSGSYATTLIEAIGVTLC